MSIVQSPQDLLKTTLSNATACQAFLGTDNSTAAAARIHHDALPSPGGDRYTVTELNSLRPCVILSTELYRVDKVCAGLDGDSSEWNGRGQLRALFFRTVPASITDNLSLVDTSMRELVGAIVEGLISTAETGGRLACTGITVNGPARVKPEEVSLHGDEQMCEVLIDWGVERQ